MTCGWRALSIRQPWTWCIAHGFKPVENRDWRLGHPGRHYRGDVLLHASLTFDHDGYDWILETFPAIQMPSPSEFERGGIVGRARITGIVTELDSPWFFGPVGLLMAAAAPLPFQPCKGALGFFNPGEAARSFSNPIPGRLL